ncbi:MAG: ribose-5-phosphate isomerase RpiA [Candidatus Micrarchaeota archaeon]|nr:ribose-5-phosphate isomerase RpiA [Candidatus Micrarchaeota archaeon]
MSSLELEKINAAKAALEYVQDGMILGLGSGTTAREFIKLLAERVKKEKLNIIGVPSSFDTRILSHKLGLSIAEADEVDQIDLAIDGADVATKTGLLKGGGGALTREKVVAYAAKKFICIVDSSKVKERLEGKVVVEVVPFAYNTVMKELYKFSKKVGYRVADEKIGPIITDNGNFLLDVEMFVKDPKRTEIELKNIPGVVESGIFTKFDKVIVGTKDESRIL